MSVMSVLSVWRMKLTELTKLTEQKMYVRLWDFETADCRNRILSRKGTIISGETDEERTCLLGGGAGRSPRDRVIGGLRERRVIMNKSRTFARLLYVIVSGKY